MTSTNHNREPGASDKSKIRLLALYLREETTHQPIQGAFA